MEHEELGQIFETLKSQWQRASEEWGDSDSQKHYFEREFWVEWERTVPSVVEALSELDDAIKEIEQ